METTYEIIDRQTGAVVGNAKTAKSARASVERRDLNYGGYRYGYQPVGGWVKSVEVGVTK